MYILYTVAPLRAYNVHIRLVPDDANRLLVYRMASSAYYNLSLLSSDFYGLLFGLFLYVRTAVAAFHSASEMNARAGLADAIHSSSLSPLALTALHRLLAVLRRLRRGHLRARHLFLARNAYVSLPPFTCPAFPSLSPFPSPPPPPTPDGEQRVC